MQNKKNHTVEGESMERIVVYLQTHWVIWLFTLMGSALGYMIRRLQQQQKESRAISEGVQSLLRESIVRNYNKYQNKGYCPIYAKESMRHVYEAYHKLGGNDVATRLYTTLLAMPEENEEASPANEKQGIVPDRRKRKNEYRGE